MTATPREVEMAFWMVVLGTVVIAAWFATIVFGLARGMEWVTRPLRRPRRAVRRWVS